MADYIKKIRTEAGDLQIDYEALANKPQFDADWKAANNLADATVVNNKIKGVEDKVNAANTEIDQLAAAIEALGGDLGDIGSYGYITETELNNKLNGYVTDAELYSNLNSYVTDAELDAKGYLTGLPVATTTSPGVVRIGSGLSVTSTGVISVTNTGSGTSSEDYVTETELLNKGYLTSSTLPKASNYSSTYGVVLPSTDDFTCSNGYLQLEDIPLTKLSDVVVDTTGYGSRTEGYWYLIPASVNVGGDG